MNVRPTEFEPLDVHLDGMHIVGDYHDEEGQRHHLVRCKPDAAIEGPVWWRNALLWKEAP